MKVQIVYLNPEDDIHSTRDMLSWVKAPRALLVWPEQGSVLSRRLDLILLKRYSQQRGIEIGMMTFDREIREEALELGIPVFESMDALSDEKWLIKETIGEKPHLSKISDLEAFPMSGEHEIQEGWFDRLNKSGKTILIGAVVFSFILGLAILLPSVRVILYPSLSEFSFNFELDQLSEGVVESEGIRIPIQTELFQSRGLATRETSGLAQVPVAAAAGYVTFISLSQTPIEIPAGTTLRTSGEDGVRFRTILSASLEADIGAEVEVPVEALTMGWSGNVPSQSISLVDGPLGLLVQVSNADPTSGGQSEICGMVLQEDLDQVENELINEMLQTTERDWYDANPSGRIPVSGSLGLRNILERKFDHVPGEIADTITLELEIEFSVLVLPKEELQNLVKIRYLDPQSLRYLPAPGGVSFSSRMKESLVESQNRQIEVAVKVDAYHALDVGKMKEAIRGHRPSTAKELLLELYPLTSPPEFRINPNWYPILPLISQRIDFVWSWE